MEKKNIKQPTLDEQKELNDILTRKATYIEVRNKKWKSAPLFNGTLRKMTDIFLSEKEEDKVNAKCAAAFLLNGYWSIKFFYWIVWRWMYYVKQYTNAELLPYILECKKKMGVEEYFLATISLTEMTDTWKQMTRKEVQAIQVELASAQLGLSQKSTQTSSRSNTTSEG